MPYCVARLCSISTASNAVSYSGCGSFGGVLKSLLHNLRLFAGGGADHKGEQLHISGERQVHLVQLLGGGLAQRQLQAAVDHIRRGVFGGAGGSIQNFGHGLFAVVHGVDLFAHADLRCFGQQLAVQGIQFAHRESLHCVVFISNPKPARRFARHKTKSAGCGGGKGGFAVTLHLKFQPRHVCGITAAGVGNAQYTVKFQLSTTGKLPLKAAVAGGAGAPGAVGNIIIAGIADVALAGQGDLQAFAGHHAAHPAFGLHRLPLLHVAVNGNGKGFHIGDGVFGGGAAGTNLELVFKYGINTRFVCHGFHSFLQVIVRLMAYSNTPSVPRPRGTGPAPGSARYTAAPDISAPIRP
nr:MAG TPA: hypothetical protein [Caudoviricetes sp.]